MYGQSQIMLHLPKQLNKVRVENDVALWARNTNSSSIEVVMRRMTSHTLLCHSLSLANRKINHDMTGDFVLEGLSFLLSFLLRDLSLDLLLVSEILFV